MTGRSRFETWRVSSFTLEREFRHPPPQPPWQKQNDRQKIQGETRDQGWGWLIAPYFFFPTI